MSSHGIAQFDVWQPGYAGATVTVLVAGTQNLAAIYYDEALTDPAPNPQILDSREQNGIQYGKFERPLYTAEDYALDIDTIDETGTTRKPIYTLDGEDASGAVVTPSSGSNSVTIADLAARVVHAENHGEIGTSSATNTATIRAAIARAQSVGGGRVVLPAGIVPFNDFTIPANVTVEGQSRNATTLRSQKAGNVVTLSGDRAGLARLTLDGVNSVIGGVGIYSRGVDDVTLEDVRIRRFALTVHGLGGFRWRWRNVTLEDGIDGAKLHGDSDVNEGGSAFRDMIWEGGSVERFSGLGVNPSFIDRICSNIALRGVLFKDNTGTALRVNGARHTLLDQCVFEGNTRNFHLRDDDDPTAWEENTLIGFRMRGGRISGGDIEIEDSAQDVILEGVPMDDLDIVLTSPENPVLALDCIEAADVTISGDGTKWTRARTTETGASAGLTSGNTATKAWGMPLAAGQLVYLEAKVLGNQRNGENTGEYHISVSAIRPGDELDYDTQTDNFTVGAVVTGDETGCSALIVADSDSGATGTLTLRNIVPGPTGEFFKDNERITCTGGGIATVNGALQPQAAQILGSVTSLRSAREDDGDWAVTFVANGQEIELQVTGDTGQEIEWLCHVEVVTT